MSLAELLPAIRALPRAEQVQLLHLLVDGVAEAPPYSDADRKLLDALLPSGATFDVHTPPDGYEAAGQLLQLLSSQGGRV